MRELIVCCCDRSSDEWELAWREFDCKYKNYIYKVIINGLKRYQREIPAIKERLLDFVNDAFGQVLTTLVDNDCRVLRQFRELDSEPTFLRWLAKISNSAVSHQVQAYNRKILVGEKVLPKSKDNPSEEIDFDFRWRLYEHNVVLLRENKRSRKPNLERDIFIFHLYTLWDFSSEMLKHTPCLRGIGPRVVDVVVNRARAFLRTVVK